MSLRRLLNAAYSALAEGRDEDGLKKLDGLLEADGSGPSATIPSGAPRGNFQALIAAARMPQERG